MKQSIQRFACILAAISGTFAQTPEKFDIVTVRIPNAWNKQVSADSLQISTEDKAAGTFCLITVYRSIPASNDSKVNFDLAWKSIVKETVGVSAAAQMQP